MTKLKSQTVVFEVIAGSKSMTGTYLFSTKKIRSIHTRFGGYHGEKKLISSEKANKILLTIQTFEGQSNLHKDLPLPYVEAASKNAMTTGLKMDDLIVDWNSSALKYEGRDAAFVAEEHVEFVVTYLD
jgi:hypothetical protein